MESTSLYNARNAVFCRWSAKYKAQTVYAQKPKPRPGGPARGAVRAEVAPREEPANGGTQDDDGERRGKQHARQRRRRARERSSTRPSRAALRMT